MLRHCASDAEASFRDYKIGDYYINRPFFSGLPEEMSYSSDLPTYNDRVKGMQAAFDIMQSKITENGRLRWLDIDCGIIREVWMIGPMMSCFC